MLQDTSRNKWRRFGPVLISAFAVGALIAMPVGRNLLARAFRSLRTGRERKSLGFHGPERESRFASADRADDFR
jgi:hypothetical protein